jgi:Domain of unknown function (DUF4268)
LRSRAEDIEAKLGEPLTWYEAEGVKMRRVYVRRAVDFYEQGQWPEYHAWLHARLVRFLEVFRPLADEIGAAMPEEEKV